VDGRVSETDTLHATDHEGPKGLQAPLSVIVLRIIVSSSA
jgi:hypothetical protein